MLQKQRNIDLAGLERDIIGDSLGLNLADRLARLYALGFTLAYGLIVNRWCLLDLHSSPELSDCIPEPIILGVCPQ